MSYSVHIVIDPQQPEMTQSEQYDIYLNKVNCWKMLEIKAIIIFHVALMQYCRLHPVKSSDLNTSTFSAICSAESMQLFLVQIYFSISVS